MKKQGAKPVGRISCFVDGFNLYWGMKYKKLDRYLWLDIRKLMESVAGGPEHVVSVNYFTAFVLGDADKQKRQTSFIEALVEHSGLHVVLGSHQADDRVCKKCGHVETRYSEKMTDVGLAVQLMTEASQNTFDTAIILSADSDLVPSLQAVRDLYPEKTLISVFPPGRGSNHLRKASHGVIRIDSEPLFAACQLPEEITKGDGYVLRRPDAWK
ncbi:MAG TPA: NYN domain-containing protein [Phycisphaerae bacterium]|nr:NYN domain-containing protein [Phycisphaerae bacterium]